MNTFCNQRICQQRISASTDNQFEERKLFIHMGDNMKIENIITGYLIQKENVYSKEDLINKINIIKRKIGSLNDEIIAIAIPRNVYLITTIVALFESNIAFLPIDLEQPYERIDYMLSLAKVYTIFTVSEYKHMFDGYQVICVNENNSIDLNKKVISRRQSSKLAYILFTSGTTGRPKGVEVTRKGFNNFIRSIPNCIDFPDKSVVLCLTSASFDIFLLETVMALYCGFGVVLADEEEQQNPKKIVGLLKKYDINVVQFTPSRLKMVEAVDKQFESFANIETILVGGEKFPSDLLKKLQSNTNAQIYNMYGPTETTIWSSVSELTNKDQIDVGKPIDNTTIYILDERLIEVRQGEVGEICIAGDGVAIGYVNSVEQTEKSFKRLGFSPYDRVYCTGDLGYLDCDENIVCLGRKDEQIKYHGYRIELQDIEANIALIEGIEECVVCFDSEYEQLILFYKSTSVLEENVIKNEAKHILPYYMVPHHIIHVDNFIYSISGKVNRHAMVNSLHSTKELFNSHKVLEADNSTIDKMISVIKGCRGICKDEVSVHTSIEELMLDSISYIELIADIEEVFDIEFDNDKLNKGIFDKVQDIVIYVNGLLEQQERIMNSE